MHNLAVSLEPTFAGEGWWRSKSFLFALILPMPLWLIFYLVVQSWQLSLPIASSSVWSVLIAQVLIYPVLEECVFRGLLQGWLRRFEKSRVKLIGLSIANLLVSLVFVCCHFVLEMNVFSIAVFFPSLVFGFLYDRFGTVRPGIVVHMFYNFGFLALLRFLF